MTKFRTCIIGCGAIFPVHASALAQREDVTLIAVADLRPERAQAPAARFSCRAYTDWREMLAREKPDAVHICAPHYLHAPMAAAALRGGANVLIEKPVALNVADARQIAEARDQSGKTAAVVFQNRLNDSVRAARQVLDGGRFGRLLGVRGQVAWHRDDAYYRDSGWRGRFATEGGGVLMNQSIHTLDLMLGFAGRVKSLRARVDNLAHTGVIEVEDTAEAVLQFESGVRGLFFATTANFSDSPVELELQLEQATVLLRGDEAFLCRKDGEQELCRPSDAPTGFKDCWGSGHARLIGRFYDGLAHGAAPFVSVEQAQASLRVIEAIYRSSRSGRPAEVEWGVPPETPQFQLA